MPAIYESLMWINPTPHFSSRNTEKKYNSFLLAEIPSRKFMFFYSLRNEFLRSENEFHRFLFSKKMNLPEEMKKISKNG